MQPIAVPTALRRSAPLPSGPRPNVYVPTATRQSSPSAMGPVAFRPQSSRSIAVAPHQAHAPSPTRPISYVPTALRRSAPSPPGLSRRAPSPTRPIAVAPIKSSAPFTVPSNHAPRVVEPSHAISLAHNKWPHRPHRLCRPVTASSSPLAHHLPQQACSKGGAAFPRHLTGPQ